jgi:hypothetical protein
VGSPDRIIRDHHIDLLCALWVDAELLAEAYCSSGWERAQHDLQFSCYASAMPAWLASEMTLQNIAPNTDLRLSILRLGYSRLRHKRDPTIIYCRLFVSLTCEFRALLDEADER